MLTECPPLAPWVCWVVLTAVWSSQESGLGASSGSDTTLRDIVVSELNDAYPTATDLFLALKRRAATGSPTLDTLRGLLDDMG